MNYKEMFDYYKAERAKLIEAFEELPLEEFAKNRELSYYSLKGTFAHTVAVENNWLHRAYRGLPNLSFDPEEFKTLDDVKRFMSEVDGKTSDLFKEITNADLDRIIHRRLSTGQEVAYRFEIVLNHIPIEVIHHYGEIFGEFWKMNLEAPYLGYTQYIGTNIRS